MLLITHSSSSLLLVFLLLLAASLSGEAVFARCLSSLKEERVEASRSLSGPQGVKYSGDKAAFLEDIRKVDTTSPTPCSNTTLHCWSGLFFFVFFIGYVCCTATLSVLFYHSLFSPDVGKLQPRQLLIFLIRLAKPKEIILIVSENGTSLRGTSFCKSVSVQSCLHWLSYHDTVGGVTAVKRNNVIPNNCISLNSVLPSGCSCCEVCE